ncbi:LLM class flavin-dependent oxidoreductase [Rhodobacter sp. KR11]|uniref:LLM class flavin-dependent oxidoreductase n=1 Tax=Rhodobacter sp. KR11 TaxID=2974588 RepID=UPI00222303F9|nr:LLM class flavin-dependent oxidoreductase [Rhodobacter sp. KR11]MCW1919431.1 LLM class flavin-dependent oxidoreductase [Rhodobacter sp. KR11]
MRYSLLDLASVAEGQTPSAALAQTADLAIHAEALGYHRFWLAEHHGMAGIASAATSVVIGHVAARTKHIRVGAGGIMLPNHAPLIIAEQFGTLDALYPGRIDLGLGRAPGTDGATARAMRRAMDPDDFPNDVAELMAYLGDPTPQTRIHAFPGEGSHVPLFILGSSTYGAQVAAHFGLPFAFASHFAPFQLEEAFHLYRSHFRPSETLAAPHAMMAIGLCAAETDDEAVYLRSSQVQAFANLRLGRPGKLPGPTHDLSHIPAPMLAEVDRVLGCSAVGSPATVQSRLKALIARHQPDEVILTGMTHSHAARLDSFRIGAEAMQALGAIPFAQAA